MAVYRHTLEQINEYFNHEAINQSALKVLISEGIQAFVDKKDELQKQSDLFYEEKKHFIIGSGVDVTMTQSEEDFLKQFHISQLIKKPGPKAMSVINRAYAMAKEEYEAPYAALDMYKDIVYAAANEEEYFMNRRKPDVKDDTRIETLLKDNGLSYWVDLCIAEGKQILSDDENGTITAIVNAFKTHPHTWWLFKEEEDEGVDIVYQMPLYFVVNEVNCKALVDMMRIDHNRKRIMNIDIKTLGDYVTKFPNAVDYRRYDIQGSFYTEGVRQSLEAISKVIGKDITDYAIANFAFVVESTIRPGVPLIFVLKNDMVERGRLGGLSRSNFRFVGYEEALTKYKQWLDLDFSLNRRFEKEHGVIQLGTDYDMNINL